MPCCFAVIPDETCPEGAQPVALFADLEDAIDWGLSRYKGGSFRLRYAPVTVLEADEAVRLRS
jgi:hypothetical protein